MIYEDKGFSRYRMYRDIEEHIRKSRWLSRKGEGLTVGGSSPIVDLFKNIKWTVSNINVYKDHSELEWATSHKKVFLANQPVDVQNMKLDNDTVDILICDQVLEHIAKPWEAASEMMRVLKRGGIFILTTCYMQKWHLPQVYFTFHMDGLTSLFGEYLDEVYVDGWGNHRANSFINEYNLNSAPVDVDPSFKALIETKDPEAPFVTWIIGLKK